MKVNFDRTSKTGKANIVPINQGAAYTALSRAKSRAKLQLLNFNREHIKVNVAALNEINRIREHAVFTWQRPISQGSENKIVLSNLRSWNAHIEQFITDTEITKYCDIMCFTETYRHVSNFTEISNYINGWKDMHICTEHELAFCFKEQSLNVAGNDHEVGNNHK